MGKESSGACMPVACPPRGSGQGQGHLLSLGGEVEKGPVKMPCVDGWRSSQVVYAGDIQTLTSCWEWQGQGHLVSFRQLRGRERFLPVA